MTAAAVAAAEGRVAGMMEDTLEEVVAVDKTNNSETLL